MVGDFKREILSINCQFFIFLVAYLSRCGYIVFLISVKLSQEMFDLLFFLVAFVCMVVPCFTVLLLHHKALYPRLQG